MSSGLAIKLSGLIGKAAYVKKSGHNSFHKYNYATEGDFLSLIKPLLDGSRLAVIASQDSVTREELEPTIKGRRQWLTTVKMSFKIVDGDTGETETLTAFGTGIDSEDKGLYKAITGCVKYFISKLFLIETGDDPERENENETGEAKQEDKKPENPLVLEIRSLAHTVDEMSADEALKTASGFEKDGTKYFLTWDGLGSASEKWLKKTIAGLRALQGV